jgi:uncharacterized protein
VIRVDANLLIYSHVRGLSVHERARHWFDSRLNGSMPVGLPWPSILSFLRITTNPRVFERPVTIADAWKQINGWLECSTVWVPQLTEHHAEILGGLLVDSNIKTNLVPDAHLAALAIEHGLTLCSTDGDFARFSGLKWENPIS